MRKILFIFLLFAITSSYNSIAAQLSSGQTEELIADYDKKINYYKSWRAANAITGTGLTLGSGALISTQPLIAFGIPVGMILLNQAGNNNLKIYQLQMQKKIALTSGQDLKEHYVMDVQKRFNRSANAKIIGGSVLAGAGLGMIGAGIIVYDPSDSWSALGLAVIIYTGTLAVLSGTPFIISGINYKIKAKMILATGNLPEIVSTSSMFPSNNTQYMAMGLKIPLGW